MGRVVAAVAGIGIADVTIAPDSSVTGLVILLNVAGLGYIAYLLVKASIAENRETRAAVNANTSAVNRLVRMWSLWLVTERRDIPEVVRTEARALLEESRAAAGVVDGPSSPS